MVPIQFVSLLNNIFTQLVPVLGPLVSATLKPLTGILQALFIDGTRELIYYLRHGWTPNDYLIMTYKLKPEEVRNSPFYCSK